MSIITVVIPVYKVEQYIHRCIDSVLAQTFADFELILVDDGSPDKCGSICDEYAQNDSRIHVIHKKNGGLSAARNTGIEWAFANSNSQWLTFIDSDDWIHPQYLEVLLLAATHLNVKIACCNHQETKSPTADIPFCKIPSPKLADAEEAYHASACYKLYAREYFTDVRFPIGKLHEDAFTTYKVFFREAHVALVDAPLYYYTINPQEITHSKWYPKRMEEYEAFEEQLSFFKNRTSHEFFAKTVRLYLYAMIGQLKSIEKDAETIPQFRHYLKLVRGKMRKVMCTYKTQVGLTIKKYPQFYESAYPGFMKLYWLTKGFQLKLATLFSHHSS